MAPRPPFLALFAFLCLFEYAASFTVMLSPLGAIRNPPIGNRALSYSRHNRRQNGFSQLKCSVSEELRVGVADEVQNVGRGALLSKNDAVKEVSGKVKGLYDAYPYPPEAVFDGPTVGYNHRWSWTHAHSFCTGDAPARNNIEILDAGCGTGVTAQYISHLNPRAVHFDALDLSGEALKIAKERAQRAGLVGAPNNAVFHHMSLYDVAQLGRHYDFINCVGVLHHLPDPVKGLRALCERLKPGGLLHVFVYSALGRREIMLMQEALALLQGGDTDFVKGVALGREVFAALPTTSRIKQREQERWAMENQRDSTFADMYLHPQEVDYTVPTLFQWIDSVADLGISFAGFSNPAVWDLTRLLGNAPEALARAQALPERQRYRLAELLDPDTFTHYEFFLTRAPAGAPPAKKRDWSKVTDAELMGARAVRQAGLQPWPAERVFDLDYNLITLSEAEQALLEALPQDPTVESLEWGDDGRDLNPPTLAEVIAGLAAKPSRAEILRLHALQFLFLRPG